MAWLQGWKFRKAITITDQTGQSWTDAQVKIDLTNEELQQAQSTGIDVRFTQDDGTTLLSFWREKFDGIASGQTKLFWVKVPSIPANSSVKIYVYWGNPSASDVSSTTDTFIDDIDGLVAAYHMDEGGGTILHDSSGNGHDGTINGATWTNGRYGSALQFDGSNDYVDIAGGWLPTSTITVAIWFNPSSYSTTVWRKFLNTGPSANKGLYGSQGALDGDVWVIGLTWDNRNTTVEVSKELCIGNWNFLAIGWDGINVYGGHSGQWGYIKQGGTNPDWAGRDIVLGANYIHTENYAGKLDELLIFDHCLTESNISNLYNNYGHTTLNYPSHVLVRQWIDPEPSVSIGSLEAYEQLTASATVTASLSVRYVYHITLTASTTPTAAIHRIATYKRTLQATITATASVSRILAAHRTLSITIMPTATVTAKLVYHISLATSTIVGATLSHALSAYRQLAAAVSPAASIQAKKVIKTCGLPDFTPAVGIRAQTISRLAVDITAQSIGSLDVNIAGSTATIDVNIASSATTLDVNITGSSTTFNVNITGSSTTLNVNVANTTPIDINIAASSVSLNVNVSNTVNVNVTNSSLNVNVTNSTLNVNITNTQVGVSINASSVTLDINSKGGTLDSVSYSDMILKSNCFEGSVARTNSPTGKIEFSHVPSGYVLYFLGGTLSAYNSSTSIPEHASLGIYNPCVGSEQIIADLVVGPGDTTSVNVSVASPVKLTYPGYFFVEPLGDDLDVTASVRIVVVSATAEMNTIKQLIERGVIPDLDSARYPEVDSVIFEQPQQSRGDKVYVDDNRSDKRQYRPEGALQKVTD